LKQPNIKEVNTTTYYTFFHIFNLDIPVQAISQLIFVTKNVDYYNDQFKY